MDEGVGDEDDDEDDDATEDEMFKLAENSEHESVNRDEGVDDEALLRGGKGAGKTSFSSAESRRASSTSWKVSNRSTN